MPRSQVTVINPRCMRKGYGSRFVCVSMSVTTVSATYFDYKFQYCYKGSLCCFNCTHCLDLSENVSFSTFGIQPLLPGEFSMDRMNISGLFSRYKVCSSSDGCYKTTADKSY